MNDIVATVSAYLICAVSLWLATREKKKVKNEWRRPVGPLLRLAVLFLGFHFIFLAIQISALEGYLFIALFVVISFVGVWLDPFLVLLIVTSYVFFEWVFWFPDRDSYVLSRAVKGEKKRKEVKEKIGIAISDLKPVGQIEIEGQKFDARSSLGFISKGDPVEIVSQSGFEMIVNKIGANQASLTTPEAPPPTS